MTTDLHRQHNARAQVMRGLAMHLDEQQQDDIMATSTTRGPRPNSFNSLVQELAIGESVSKVRAVDPTTQVQRLPAELPEIRTQVRNACSPAVTRAKEITGGTYTVEVGDALMPGGSYYVVAVITRTA